MTLSSWDNAYYNSMKSVSRDRSCLIYDNRMLNRDRLNKTHLLENQEVLLRQQRFIIAQQKFIDQGIMFNDEIYKEMCINENTGNYLNIDQYDHIGSSVNSTSKRVFNFENEANQEFGKTSKSCLPRHKKSFSNSHRNPLAELSNKDEVYYDKSSLVKNNMFENQNESMAYSIKPLENIDFKPNLSKDTEYINFRKQMNEANSVYTNRHDLAHKMNDIDLSFRTSKTRKKYFKRDFESELDFIDSLKETKLYLDSFNSKLRSMNIEQRDKSQTNNIKYMEYIHPGLNLCHDKYKSHIVDLDNISNSPTMKLRLKGENEDIYKIPHKFETKMNEKYYSYADIVQNKEYICEKNDSPYNTECSSNLDRSDSQNNSRNYKEYYSRNQITKPNSDTSYPNLEKLYCNRSNYRTMREKLYSEHFCSHNIPRGNITSNSFLQEEIQRCESAPNCNDPKKILSHSSTQINNNSNIKKNDNTSRLIREINNQDILDTEKLDYHISSLIRRSKNLETLSKSKNQLDYENTNNDSDVSIDIVCKSLANKSSETLVRRKTGSSGTDSTHSGNACSNFPINELGLNQVTFRSFNDDSKYRYNTISETEEYTNKIVPKFSSNVNLRNSPKNIYTRHLKKQKLSNNQDTLNLAPLCKNISCSDVKNYMEECITPKSVYNLQASKLIMKQSREWESSINPESSKNDYHSISLKHNIDIPESYTDKSYMKNFNRNKFLRENSKLRNIPLVREVKEDSRTRLRQSNQYREPLRDLRDKFVNQFSNTERYDFKNKEANIIKFKNFIAEKSITDLAFNRATQKNNRNIVEYGCDSSENSTDYPFLQMKNNGASESNLSKSVDNSKLNFDMEKYSRARYLVGNVEKATDNLNNLNSLSSLEAALKIRSDKSLKSPFARQNLHYYSASEKNLSSTNHSVLSSFKRPNVDKSGLIGWNESTNDDTNQPRNLSLSMKLDHRVYNPLNTYNEQNYLNSSSMDKLGSSEMGFVNRNNYNILYDNSFSSCSDLNSMNPTISNNFFNMNSNDSFQQNAKIFRSDYTFTNASFLDDHDYNQRHKSFIEQLRNDSDNIQYTMKEDNPANYLRGAEYNSSHELESNKLPSCMEYICHSPDEFVYQNSNGECADFNVYNIKDSLLKKIKYYNDYERHSIQRQMLSNEALQKEDYYEITNNLDNYSPHRELQKQCISISKDKEYLDGYSNSLHIDENIDNKLYYLQNCYIDRYKRYYQNIDLESSPFIDSRNRIEDDVYYSSYKELPLHPCSNNDNEAYTKNHCSSIDLYYNQITKNVLDSYPNYSYGNGSDINNFYSSQKPLSFDGYCDASCFSQNIYSASNMLQDDFSVNVIKIEEDNTSGDKTISKESDSNKLSEKVAHQKKINVEKKKKSTSSSVTKRSSENSRSVDKSNVNRTGLCSQKSANKNSIKKLLPNSDDCHQSSVVKKQMTNSNDELVASAAEEVNKWTATLGSKRLPNVLSRKLPGISTCLILVARGASSVAEIRQPYKKQRKRFFYGVSSKHALSRILYLHSSADGIDIIPTLYSRIPGENGSHRVLISRPDDPGATKNGLVCDSSIVRQSICLGRAIMACHESLSSKVQIGVFAMTAPRHQMTRAGEHFIFTHCFSQPNPLVEEYIRFSCRTIAVTCKLLMADIAIHTHLTTDTLANADITIALVLAESEGVGKTDSNSLVFKFRETIEKELANEVISSPNFAQKLYNILDKVSFSQ